MDEAIKEQMDLLCSRLGLPLEDAIRVFVYASVRMQGIPFPITLETTRAKKHLEQFFLPNRGPCGSSIQDAIMKGYVEASRENGLTLEAAAKRVAEKYGIAEVSAAEQVEMYWG